MMFVVVNVIEGKNRFCTLDTVPSSVSFIKRFLYICLLVLLILIRTQSFQLAHFAVLWFFPTGFSHILHRKDIAIYLFYFLKFSMVTDYYTASFILS